VGALAAEGIEIHGRDGDEGLSFPGLHFGDAALVEHHAPDDLDIELAHAQGAAAGLADHGEGFGQDGVQLGTPGQATELGRLGAELFVRQGFELRFETIDGFDDGLERLDIFVAGIKK